MKILICGDRNWSDKEAIRRVFSYFGIKPTDTLIEGEALGADTLAREVAQEKGCSIDPHIPKWSDYGKAAGPMRNREMLDEEPDWVVGFHDDISHSKGTKDCLNEAARRGTAVYVYTHEKGIEEYA